MKRTLAILALLFALIHVSGCTKREAQPALQKKPTVFPRIELVESVPLETSLDQADIPNAAAVWREMIESARARLDLAHFYVSNADNSALEPILGALEAACSRGVQIRFLLDKGFSGKYEESVLRLRQIPCLVLRRIDLKARTGGVQHAKYFIVDGKETFLGSQNFDYRALAHIQELGVRTPVPGVVTALEEVFALDWAIAGGEPLPAVGGAAIGFARARYGGEPMEVLPVASPRDLLPRGVAWDLPWLIRLIDGAKQAVRVQLLSYRATSRSGEPFPELDDALRRAQKRGVTVQLLLADWSDRPGPLEGLQDLAACGIEVRLVTIPPASTGAIPYARVVHSKYLVVDEHSAWVGTSNWERDYFYQSRNVGVILEGPALARRIDALFATLWTSPYARPIAKPDRLAR